ncbi:MAG: SiaB family protein kinase [Bacteroidales bacterium]|nr:SiaB family protein kinase [Bacteroidales bacterium]
MKEISLIEYYHRFNNDDLTLAYFGSFNDSIVEKMVNLSNSFLENSELKGIKKRAIFLVAECFQNVARHGIDNNPKFSDGKLENAFFMRVKDKLLYIASANPIRNDKIEILTQKIEYLNKLSKSDLSQLYKNVLEEGKFSDKGGASLGLIEMARKTGNKLNFHFAPGTKDHSVFYIMMSFGPPEIINTKENKKTIFNEIIKLDDELFNSNQYLLYKSDFKHETLIPIIQMIEKNLNESDSPYTIKRNLFHASVEMMQNISNHGLLRNNKKTGVFSFGRDKEAYFVTSVNELSPEEVNYLKNLFDKLKNKTEKELKLIYKVSLKSKDNQKSDLTYIDLARISKSWDYEFIPLDSDSFLLNFKIFL